MHKLYVKTLILSKAQFQQCFTCSFYACRPQKRKKTVKSFLRFWDLRSQKLLIERWWNWPLVSFTFLCVNPILCYPHTSMFNSNCKKYNSKFILECWEPLKENNQLQLIQVITGLSKVMMFLLCKFNYNLMFFYVLLCF